MCYSSLPLVWTKKTTNRQMWTGGFKVKRRCQLPTEKLTNSLNKRLWPVKLATSPKRTLLKLSGRKEFRQFKTLSFLSGVLGLQSYTVMCITTTNWAKYYIWRQHWFRVWLLKQMVCKVGKVVVYWTRGYRIGTYWFCTHCKTLTGRKCLPLWLCLSRHNSQAYFQNKIQEL